MNIKVAEKKAGISTIVPEAPTTKVKANDTSEAATKEDKVEATTETAKEDTTNDNELKGDTNGGTEKDAEVTNEITNDEEVAAGKATGRVRISLNISEVSDTDINPFEENHI